MRFCQKHVRYNSHSACRIAGKGFVAEAGYHGLKNNMGLQRGVTLLCRGV
jgi:hypothetical protein